MFHSNIGLGSPCATSTLVLMQFRDNLTARLHLLAQLQMKLPDGLNAAEEQLRDSELPGLDQQAQLLRKQIQVHSSVAVTMCHMLDNGTAWRVCVTMQRIVSDCYYTCYRQTQDFLHFFA